MSDIGPRPEHDCPCCPECFARVGVPIRTHHRAAEYDKSFRLVCPACGHGWEGTNAEVLQAERAEAAWEKLQDGTP